MPATAHKPKAQTTTVRLPRSLYEQSGKRPVVIISRDAINHNSSVVVCVPCTGLENCTKIYPSQVLFKKGVGMLDKDSVAMCDQVRAITVNRLEKYLGKLDSKSL